MVVVGAGGSGLRATLGMAEQGLRQLRDKSFPTRSPVAQIAASLSNMGPDHWHGTWLTRLKDQIGWATQTRWNISHANPKAVYN